jgi:hypothetical protein
LIPVIHEYISVGHELWSCAGQWRGSYVIS